MEKKRVLICEFHQESDTFNPITMPLSVFAAYRYAEGQEAYDRCKEQVCAFHGMIDSVEEAGGEAIPAISLYSSSGGRVADDVYQLLCERTRYYIETAGHLDGVFVSLHGACCTESLDDASGTYLEYIRSLVGQEMVVAASFDLHGNITEKILKNADIVCGYQSYPHVDHYETGLRAARFGMRKLLGQPTYMAATIIPMMVPPAGYTSLEEPFKSVIDTGMSLISDGTLLDFTTFQVQPWLDVADIGSTVCAIAEDPETAQKYADLLAEKLFANRDGYWPDLLSIDEILEKAENNTSGKPVIFVDAADSPNGGAVGDSIVPVMPLVERGSKVRAGMFLKDPEAVRQAFEVGVGKSAVFEIGNKITPSLPAPMKAEGRVRSLHDGWVRHEGPAEKGVPFNVGLSAVISFGNVDVMVCEDPAATGDPQLLRHFGIEPKLYDLIVVKANTSFKVPYSSFAGEICYADSPGAGSSNLKSFHWTKLPKGFYPFDLPEDYQPEKAKFWR